MTNRPLLGKRPAGMLDHLTTEEWDKIEPQFTKISVHAPGEIISGRGQLLDHSLLVTDGIVGRYVKSSGAERGCFTALQVPGDFVDLHAFPLKRLDHAVVALTPARVAMVLHSDLAALLNTEIELTRTLWALTLVDASIHRHWAMRNASMRALARLANFFAEFDTRMNAGLTRPSDTHQLDVTQTDLGDACGLTAVHINRVLKDLREDGCCIFRNGTLDIADRARLQKLGQFDAAYLYLPNSDAKL